MTCRLPKNECTPLSTAYIKLGTSSKKVSHWQQIEVSMERINFVMMFSHKGYNVLSFRISVAIRRIAKNYFKCYTHRQMTTPSLRFEPHFNCIASFFLTQPASSNLNFKKTHTNNIVLFPAIIMFIMNRFTALAIMSLLPSLTPSVHLKIPLFFSRSGDLGF
jgi:hypothetical protein